MQSRGCDMNDIINRDLGTRLRTARRQRGLSLHDVAGRTKLSMGVVQAIECNDFQRLPGGVYRKGYLRSLAGEVGLDPRQIAADYDKEFGSMAISADTSRDRAFEHGWFGLIKRTLTTLWFDSGRRLRMLTVIMVAISAIAVAAAQEGASSKAAPSLVSALNESGLDSIASVDPTEPGAFIAALHIKGGQLLVVRARHPSVDAISARLAARQFRDVYIDLQATPTPQGKVFVMDSGADGLPADAAQSANVDVVYEDGTRQTMFNGARAQNLKEDAYLKQLHDADLEYTRLLNVLNTAITTNWSAQPGTGF